MNTFVCNLKQVDEYDLFKSTVLMIRKNDPIIFQNAVNELIS
jgi:hypothetical protein